MPIWITPTPADPIGLPSSKRVVESFMPALTMSCMPAMVSSSAIVKVDRVIRNQGILSIYVGSNLYPVTYRRTVAAVSLGGCRSALSVIDVEQKRQIYE